MKIKEGIILYNIELNDCLNGVYTNDDPNLGGEIFNEIAKIKDKRGKENDITGLYDCFYFEFSLKGNVPVNAILEVTLEGKGKYKFLWTALDGKKQFVGIGYKMNDRQIAVNYHSY